MPADKYGFAPSEGEFKGVRSFGQQVKHLSATNTSSRLPLLARIRPRMPAMRGDLKPCGLRPKCSSI
jgi:hypothetical protein